MSFDDTRCENVHSTGNDLPTTTIAARYGSDLGAWKGRGFGLPFDTPQFAQPATLAGFLFEWEQRGNEHLPSQYASTISSPSGGLRVCGAQHSNISSEISLSTSTRTSSMLAGAGAVFRAYRTRTRPTVDTSFAPKRIVEGLNFPTR